MKRVALLLTLVVALLALASCGGEEVHVHTYEQAWSSDAAGHWHNATCDCEDLEVEKADHVDKNNDKICDWCEFTDHKHTYASKWTSDADSHWHAASCGCIVAGTDKAAHADADGDGVCDECAFVIENKHNHIYSDVWSSDANYHWHAAICEHTTEIADKAAHLIDAAGYCTVCEESINKVSDVDFAAVLEAAIAREHKIIGGKVLYNNYIYSGTMDALKIDSSIVNNVYYTLGSGQSYINFASIIDGVAYAEQYWYEKINDNFIFGVSSIDGGITFEKVDGADQHLNGYNYTPSGVLASFDSTDTLAKTLYALYSLYNHENTLNQQKSVSKGVYSFSFDHFTKVTSLGLDPSGDIETDDKGNVTSELNTNINTNYYVVTVKFTINEDGIIDYAKFVVDAYQEFYGEGDVAVDVDYTYDAATNTFNWSANKNPDRYGYEVNQVSGDRVYHSNYPYSTLVPSDFDLSVNGQVIKDSMTAKRGETIYFDLVNLSPTLSDPKFLYFTTDLNDFASGEVYLYNPATGEAKSAWFDFQTGRIGTVVTKTGEWKLIIKKANIYKEITIYVGEVTPASVQAHVFYENSGWGETWLEVSDAANSQSAVNSVTIKAGEELLFTALISPSVANQSCKYTCNKSGATITEKVLTDGIVFDTILSEGTAGDPTNPTITYTAHSFVANTAGTYVITITSTANSSVSTTLVITVQ